MIIKLTMLNKDQIRSEFEKKFKCINSGCDGRGNIPHQVGEGDWEAEQCQFHAEYLFPILLHLSAQYEKLIGECLPEKCIVHNLPQTTASDAISLGYNEAIREIRTSLQERGFNLK